MSVVRRFDLSGCTVIITGGAGLLGGEYSRCLAQIGAKVVVADIDGEAAEQLAAAIIAEDKGQALGIQVDVADKSSVCRMVEHTLSSFGRIDGLVNNAAIDPKFEGDQVLQHVVTFENYPLELWQKSLAVNITGMFLCAQAVAPTMLDQKYGVIVNVSSMYGMVGPDQRLYERDDAQAPKTFKPVTYSVTKSAVMGLTHYLATYWAGKNIRVNTLTLGGIFNNHSEEFTRRYNARTPLGRMADRSEASGALLFLLSDASSYMTGGNLVIDGGWTAW